MSEHHCLILKIRQYMKTLTMLSLVSLTLSALGQTIVDDQFTSATGRANPASILGGGAVEGNLPGGVWTGKGAVGGSYGFPSIVTYNGRQAASLRGDIGAVIPIASAGAYTKPARIRLESTFHLANTAGGGSTRVGGIGFWANATEGLANSPLGFYGVSVEHGGALKLNVNPSDTNGWQAVETLPNAGGWVNGGWHTLAYSVNTTDGRIYDVELDGQSYEFTAAFAPFGPAVTNYAGIMVSSADGSREMYFDSFRVSFADKITLRDDRVKVFSGSVLVDVLVNDQADIGPLTLVSVTQGSHGAVSIEGGKVRYVAGGNYAGADSFTYTVQDGTGRTATATVNITDGPFYDIVVAQGATLPGAGVIESGIPVGAVWNAFGAPALSEEMMVFTGTWKSPSGSGNGVFFGYRSESLDAGNFALALKVGDPTPMLGNHDFPPSGSVIKSISAPVIDRRGRNVCVLAKISDPNGELGGGPTKTYQALISIQPGEGTEPVMRSGLTVKTGKIFRPEIHGVIQSVGLEVNDSASHDGFVRVTAPKGEPAELYFFYPGEIHLGPSRLEHGDYWTSDIPNETIKSFRTMLSLPGTTAAGRQGASDLFSVTLSGGRQAILRHRSDETVAITGGETRSLTVPGSRWNSLGTIIGDYTLAFKGSLKTGFGGVTSANSGGIFALLPDAPAFEPVVRGGDVAPGFESGVVFSSFSDPAVGSGLAFMGKANGPGTTALNDAGIWWFPNEFPSTPQLLAREGAQPPGVPAGAEWKAFSSLAVSGWNPLFTATMRIGPGGVTSADDKGLWGVDSQGELKLLLREGQSVLRKTVRSFRVLEAAAGSGGTMRTYNHDNTVLAVVKFTDAETSVVKLELP